MNKLAVGDLIDFDYDIDFTKYKVSELKELYKEMEGDYDYNAQCYINDFEQVVEWYETYEHIYEEVLSRDKITKQNFYELLNYIESDLKRLNIKDNTINRAVDMALSRFL